MNQRIPTKRYGFFLGTFLITLLLYVDRVCISSAKDSIGTDLNLTDIQMGWVLSAFALGYALFQVPGGALGDKYGVRKVMTTIMVLWSIFTALTGAAWNYISMLFFRFIFGAGEAGAFPNISRAAFSWVPTKERGIFQGINFSGSRLGAAFALPLVAYLIDAWGWRNIFYFFGAIGIIFAVLFYTLFSNKPEEHKALSDVEKEYIVKNRQHEVEKVGGNLPLKTVLTSKNVILAMIQYIGSNFIFFFTLTWLFPYIKAKYGLSLVTTGFYAMLPLLGGAVGNWVSGFMVDAIYKKGKWKQSRQYPATIGFVFVVIGIIASLYMDTALGAVLCLTVAIFGADMTLSPSWSFCMDIGEENSGKVSGMMNMAGNLGAFTTALAFPYLREWTGTDAPFFYVAATLGGVAIFCWSFMNPNKKLNDEI
ncbi:MFS transporter [Seonamhaeicola aphaedonensis]|uniref:ACS family glucarate transporter-like MFS transporter n=1 Tax=Seonamhaeicola aphaedonensis TaxID=1461338 RepID=A0A3D9HIC4_9FLAO|nr:MFS transporter [Seonamhaeicola aphaedonensis]RED49269.1 ACS family glucarate transporter-like MFS transporter [Seonamhaeicola aphaedonensis]